MYRNRIVFIVVFIIAILVGVYCIIDLFGQQALNRLYSPTKRVSLEKGYKENIQKTIFVHNPNEPEIRIAIAPIMSPEKSSRSTGTSSITLAKLLPCNRF